MRVPLRAVENEVATMQSVFSLLHGVGRARVVSLHSHSLRW